MGAPPTAVPAVALDECALLDEARASTGLVDFGGDSFREGLRVLLGALEGEAKLNAFGRFFAHKEILRHLENRLRVARDFAIHPEIADVRIREPLFVVSLPRTGSTILHELLAQDPSNRYVATWECNLLSPPPESATYETDPRIARWEREIARTHGSEVPEFEAMHPMGARLPEECLTLMALDFQSQVFAYQFHVPSYEAWLERADLDGVYATHRRMLQYLQWRCPRERWVLKAVGHVWALESIFRVYPDARIVQTHRDPLRVLASLTSLLSTGYSMTSDEIDPRAIAAEWTESWARALERLIRFRDSGRIDPSRFYDVHYHEFLRDPVAMVERIYEHFGIELSSDAEQRIRRFLVENPQGKKGEHRYDPARFGLDARDVHERYRSYLERFGVEREPVR
jgi:hypothetical protein